jgi:hypothetical protein
MESYNGHHFFGSRPSRALLSPATRQFGICILGSAAAASGSQSAAAASNRNAPTRTEGAGRILEGARAPAALHRRRRRPSRLLALALALPVPALPSLPARSRPPRRARAGRQGCVRRAGPLAAPLAARPEVRTPAISSGADPDPGLGLGRWTLDDGGRRPPTGARTAVGRLVDRGRGTDLRQRRERGVLPCVCL